MKRGLALFQYFFFGFQFCNNILYEKGSGIVSVLLIFGFSFATAFCMKRGLAADLKVVVAAKSFPQILFPAKYQNVKISPNSASPQLP